MTWYNASHTTDASAQLAYPRSRRLFRR